MDSEDKNKETYLALYTLNSKDFRDIPNSTKDWLYISVEKDKNPAEKLEQKINEILYGSKVRNTSVEVHGFYKINKEIKLKKYIFSKNQE